MLKLDLTVDYDMRNLGKGLTTDVNRGIEIAMKKIGMHLRNKIMKDIKNRSPGSKKAVRYNPKRDVKVSPAGTSPNTDMGELMGSIQWDLLDSRSVMVGSVLDKKARALEEGTSHMKARPFIKPNADSSKDEMQDEIKKQIEKKLMQRSRRLGGK